MEKVVGPGPAHNVRLSRIGDQRGFAQAGEDWLKASSKERQRQTNLFHLKQAYELAQKALGGKRNADTAALALYFMPQPAPKALKDGTGISSALNVGADPLLFAVRTELQFDVGLAPLIKKPNPCFAGCTNCKGTSLTLALKAALCLRRDLMVIDLSKFGPATGPFLRKNLA